MRKLIVSLFSLLLLVGCGSSEPKTGVTYEVKEDGIVSVTNHEYKKNTKYNITINKTLSDGSIHPVSKITSFFTENKTVEYYVPEGTQVGITVYECDDYEYCTFYNMIDQQVVSGQNYSTDPDIAPYLVQDIWNMDEPEAKYAIELCEGISDPYKKLEKIYYYITDEYVYDESIFDEVNGEKAMLRLEAENAVKTFETKSGICQNFARLLTAMCRAVGIPTRCVTGVAAFNGVTQDAANSGHEWNEVYIDGEWHLVDATWGLVSTIGKHRDPYTPEDELNWYVPRKYEY